MYNQLNAIRHYWEVPSITGKCNNINILLFYDNF